MKVIFGFLLVIIGFTALKASAQDPQACYQVFMCGIYSLNGACSPRIPANAYNCSQSGPWQETCQVRNNKCPAPPKCPSCGNEAGSPIDLATGNTYIAQTDIQLPGLGGGLNLTRRWNSLGHGNILSMGLFGSNWSSTYEERILVDSDGYIDYSRADGSVWLLGYIGSDQNGNPTFAMAGPMTQTATLAQGETNWTLTFQNGETRIFDGNSGYLTSITDRNSNATQLTYDSAYRLVTVTDAAGRHLYFTYATPTTFLVTGISSDFGVSLSYSYNQLGQLTQVTKQDSTKVSFQYDNNGYITAVLDNNGKVLESHTYDAVGRGLTSSRAGSVEAITVTYPHPPFYEGP
jgi:YD repeat-containing protein